MKKLIFAIGLLAFVFGMPGCTDDSFDKSSVKGSWEVVSFTDLATGTTEFKTEENSWNRNIEIKFNDTANPNMISGTNISNQLSGEFTYGTQNQLIVTNLFSTDVFQPRWADEFITALLDPNLTFKVTPKTLVLYYDDESKSITLIKD